MLKQRLLMAASHHATGTTSTLWSWGDNANGSTAQNTTTGTTNAPTAAVDSHTNWASVVIGQSETTTGSAVIALQTDGTMWSWGNNANGYIAQGGAANKVVPTQIGTDTDWAYIAQGDNGGLAIKTNGKLYSWGKDAFGELGQGGGNVTNTSPTQVGVATDWAKVFTGWQTTFIIKTNGTLWTCGRNFAFGTGLNISAGNTTTITQIPGASNWSYVSCNFGEALALRTDGTLWCWGTDNNGELGGSVGAVYQTPTQIGVATDWSFVSLGGGQQNLNFSMFVKNTGTLWTAGSNAGYQTGRALNSGNTTPITQITGSSLWTQVYAGWDGAQGGTVGRRSDGSLWSWGTDINGNLGQGSTGGVFTTPTRIGALSSWTYLGGRGLSNFALKP